MLDEGQQQAQGQGTGLELDPGVKDERRQRGRGDELDHGEEHGVGEDGAQEGVQIAPVQIEKTRAAAGLPRVHLHQAHARELLLQIGLDGRVPALGLAIGLTRAPPEDLRGDEQEGHDAQRHRRKPHVLAEHPHDDGQQREGIAHDGHEARREHLVQVLHIADDARHQPSHGVAMEEMRAAAHQVAEKLDAQIQHGHLPHPSQQPEAQQLHDETQNEKAEERADQRPSPAQAARRDVVIDEPQRELGRRHLQRGPGGHQGEQDCQLDPVGLQVGEQAQHQGVAHGLTIHLVAAEETRVLLLFCVLSHPVFGPSAMFGHGPFFHRPPRGRC